MTKGKAQIIAALLGNADARQGIDPPIPAGTEKSAAWIRDRLAMGDLDENDVEMLAFFRHEAAQSMAKRNYSEEALNMKEWARELQRWGADVSAAARDALLLESQETGATEQQLLSAIERITGHKYSRASDLSLQDIAAYYDRFTDPASLQVRVGREIGPFFVDAKVPPFANKPPGFLAMMKMMLKGGFR